jgi:hypothetical protein
VLPLCDGGAEQQADYDGDREGGGRPGVSKVPLPAAAGAQEGVFACAEQLFAVCQASTGIGEFGAAQQVFPAGTRSSFATAALPCVDTRTYFLSPLQQW